MLNVTKLAHGGCAAWAVSFLTQPQQSGDGNTLKACWIRARSASAAGHQRSIKGAAAIVGRLEPEQLIMFLCLVVMVRRILIRTCFARFIDGESIRVFMVENLGLDELDHGFR